MRAGTLAPSGLTDAERQDPRRRGVRAGHLRGTDLRSGSSGERGRSAISSKGSRARDLKGISCGGPRPNDLPARARRRALALVNAPRQAAYAIGTPSTAVVAAHRLRRATSSSTRISRSVIVARPKGEPGIAQAKASFISFAQCYATGGSRRCKLREKRGRGGIGGQAASGCRLHNCYSRFGAGWNERGCARCPDGHKAHPS
jgi:hypothetical protein